MTHNSKIYIAGHKGMVGSAILRRLSNNKDQTQNIKIITKERKDLDLLNQQEVYNFFKSEKPDQVYLAAAKVGGIEANNNYPADFIFQNLLIQSNVIDAVRWVLGESSAKNLRSDSMTDVVFNGSSSRKPVSKASVELFFDNKEGRIGGEFSSYSEISVRRSLELDGQSIDVCDLNTQNFPTTITHSILLLSLRLLNTFKITG